MTVILYPCSLGASEQSALISTFFGTADKMFWKNVFPVFPIQGNVTLDFSKKGIKMNAFLAD
jgi:hypothetical protein